MHHDGSRRRALTAAVGVAVALTVIGFAAPARAITSTSGSVERLVARPRLMYCALAAAAGGWRPHAEVDRRLRPARRQRRAHHRRVSDGLGENCDGTGKFIGFHSLPSVTTTSDDVTLSAELLASTAGNTLRGDGFGCDEPFSRRHNDQVVLTVTSAPPTGGDARPGHLEQHLLRCRRPGGGATWWCAGRATVPPLDGTAIPSAP